MNELVTQIANALGFMGVYFVAPQQYILPPEPSPARLTLDAPAACPWASAILLLAYPYQPFEEGVAVSAYYIASNASYHAAKTLIARLKDEGVRAENINLPAKTAFVTAGVGYLGRNGLVRVSDFGSRVVLYTIAVDKCTPITYNIKNAPCGGCTKCATVCPGGAIKTQSGEHFDKFKCMRWYMEDETFPEWVLQNVETYLGCERCMRACPYNAHIPLASPTKEMLKAFDASSILCGTVKPAKAFVGNNVATRRLVNCALAIRRKQQT